MLAGLTILLTNFNGTYDANFFESLVPVKDSFANKPAIANRRCVFNVVNDRLLRRTQTQLWITLLKVPTIDVANFGLVIVVLTVVA